MAEITRETIADIKNILAEFSIDDKELDALDPIMTLLALPDEQFEVLAPGVLESFALTMNNANNKLSLVQSLNAYNIHAEELNAVYAALDEELDNSTFPVVKREFLQQLVRVLINAVQETEGISKRILIVPIELCHENAKLPEYAHMSDSGMDLFALDDITIKPGETVLVPTGIKVALPPGYELQVRPKSGRALKTKLRVANTPGTIDQGYRDEIKVIIENVDPPIRAINIKDWPLDDTNPVIRFSDLEFGQSYTIGKGEKFAQLVLAEVPKVTFERVDSVAAIGEDRGGGFGSTSIYSVNDKRNDSN